MTVAYHSMEEQASGMKASISRYWKIALPVLIVVLFAVGGVRYWKTYSQSQVDKSSVVFEDLVASMNKEGQNTIQKLVRFAYTEKNIYGVLAALKAAQFYVMELKDYKGAIALLENALLKTKNENLQNIILMRVARLQQQQNLYVLSLQTLDRIKDDNWSAMINSVRGDVLLKQHRYAESIVAYKTALFSEQASELKENIQIKLNHALYLMEKIKMKNSEVLPEKLVNANKSKTQNNEK